MSTSETGSRSFSCELISAQGVGKRFGDRVILDGLELSLSASEAVAIVGPSGSGKSTLLNILGSLESVDSGTVCVAGIDLGTLAAKDLPTFRATKVGFVFQEHHLLPQLSAIENVLLPTLACAQPRPKGEQALALLERLGIRDRAYDFPSSMSGGERQRVAVARAMINSPKLLLCDEPTGSLDGESGRSLVSLLLELAKGGMCVLSVTHNLEQAARFSRVLHLIDGRLTEENP